VNIYTIYRATNTITNKVYIGFTSETVLRRSNGHKTDALNDKSDAKFHQAIREYGWDAFVFEAIYQAKEALPPKQSHTCKVMEDLFIKEYNSLEDGYNSAPGGGAWPIMKGENHPLYGVGHSVTTKKLLSENHHDVSGSNNPMFGKLGKDNPKSVKFWAIDPSGKRYEECGIANFCRINGLLDSNVVGVLKGDRKQHKGWKFGYL
jgi:group I intron endonuclease